MKRFHRAVLLTLVLLVASSHSRADTKSPTQELQPVIEQIIATLDDDSLKGNEAKELRRSKIMSTISSGFDFREMSQRVLGSTWTELSDTEKDHFVSQFTKLLENVYIGKLEEYGGGSVDFVAERVKGKRAQVTTLIPYEGSNIPIHYIMQLQLDKWMVYDINIEGVSLVRNYMEQFKSILRSDKYDGLIKIIEEKNKAFAEENKSS